MPASVCLWRLFVFRLRQTPRVVEISGTSVPGGGEVKRKEHLHHKKKSDSGTLQHLQAACRPHAAPRLDLDPDLLLPLYKAYNEISS